MHTSSLHLHPLTSTMPTADKVAQELNRWAKEGLDMLGGSDGEALDRLLDDYFDNEDHEPQLPGCMNPKTHPLNE